MIRHMPYTVKAESRNDNYRWVVVPAYEGELNHRGARTLLAGGEDARGGAAEYLEAFPLYHDLGTPWPTTLLVFPLYDHGEPKEYLVSLLDYDDSRAVVGGLVG